MVENVHIRVRPAGRGWYHIYRGGELVAACPTRGTTDFVLSCLMAKAALLMAQTRIALLEQTLRQRLERPSLFVRLWGARK
jgi:demethoxyubiquinone hydroxylase (CLK1/Coq7/Cat5 family)